jgi:hypothetical protein
MTDTSPHPELEKVYSSKYPPPSVTGVMTGAQGRIDFELNVPKYGPGTLSVLSI